MDNSNVSGECGDVGYLESGVIIWTSNQLVADQSPDNEAESRRLEQIKDIFANLLLAYNQCKGEDSRDKAVFNILDAGTRAYNSIRNRQLTGNSCQSCESTDFKREVNSFTFVKPRNPYKPWYYPTQTTSASDLEIHV